MDFNHSLLHFNLLQAWHNWFGKYVPIDVLGTYTDSGQYIMELLELIHTYFGIDYYLYKWYLGPLDHQDQYLGSSKY